MDSGTHASLHPNSQHQIVHAKLNTPHYMKDWFEAIEKLALNCSIAQLNPSAGRNYLKIRMLMSGYISSTRPYLIFFITRFQIRK